MDDLFKHYREKTAQSAPPDLSADVMSRLARNQVVIPLYLVLGSSAGLAAAFAFAVTLLASQDPAQPPSTASLFGDTPAGLFAVRP